MRADYLRWGSGMHRRAREIGFGNTLFELVICFLQVSDTSKSVRHLKKTNNPAPSTSRARSGLWWETGQSCGLQPGGNEHSIKSRLLAQNQCRFKYHRAARHHWLSVLAAFPYYTPLRRAEDKPRRIANPRERDWVGTLYGSERRWTLGTH